MFLLIAALECGIPIIPLRMEGVTWEGKAFPDAEAKYVPDEVNSYFSRWRYSLFESLFQVTVEGITFEVRPLLRKLFTIKAVEHSREYFDGFIQKLLSYMPKAYI